MSGNPYSPPGDDSVVKSGDEDHWPRRSLAARVYHLSFMPVGALLLFSWLPIVVRFGPNCGGRSIPGLVIATLFAALVLSVSGLVVRYLCCVQIKRRRWDTQLQLGGLLASVLGLLLCVLDRLVAAKLL